MPGQGVNSEDRHRLTVDKVTPGTTEDYRIQADYTDLGVVEAFRELVQNWRDECVKQGSIPEEDVMRCIVRDDSELESMKSTIFTFWSSAGSKSKKILTRRCLGYIQYLASNGNGTVEIVNYSVTLQPWYFNMGGTTKRNNQSSVGTHGEGLNIATLALLRSKHNHGLRCFSGGLEWNFDLSKARTLCVTWQDADQRGPPNLIPCGRRRAIDAKKDTCFIFGEAGRRGRNERGESVARVGVTEEMFRSCLGTTLFLQQISRENILKTPAGSLLLNHGSPGKLYLLQFLLSEPSAGTNSLSGKPLRFSYNFNSGKTNRERAHVADASEEGKLIMLIWNDVLKDHHDMTRYLSEMLMSQDPDYADVHMAQKHLNNDAARALKRHLMEQYPDSWLYSDAEVRADPEIIRTIENLGLQPRALPVSYFNALKRHGVLRSMKEENRRILQGATTIDATDLADTPFTREAHRMVQHFATYCPSMSSAEIEVVRAEAMPKTVDCLSSRHSRVFKIHERWFDKDDAAEDMGVTLRDHQQALFCVVEALIFTIIRSIPTCHLMGPHRVLREKKREWLIRTRQVQWARELHVATSARPVTITPCPTRASGLLVQFEVPIAWRREAEVPQSARVVVQIHAMDSCNHKRWSSNEFGVASMLQCSQSCRGFEIDGRMTQIAASVEDDEQEYFALLGSLDDSSIIPLVSHSTAMPQRALELIPETALAQVSPKMSIKMPPGKKRASSAFTKAEPDVSDDGDFLFPPRLKRYKSTPTRELSPWEL